MKTTLKRLFKICLFSLIISACSDKEQVPTVNDDDNDGVVNSEDLCPNTPDGASVDSEGCSIIQKDTDGDGVLDAVDLCSNTPTGEEVDRHGCSTSQVDHPYIVWEKTYGSRSSPQDLWVLENTPDGGYILGGITWAAGGDILSGHKGATDCWVVKIDAQGSIEWEKTYGGSGQERLYAIQVTPDGGYIFGGSTTSNDGDIKSGNKGIVDVWVVKIDNMGLLQWEKTYGGSMVDSSHELDLAPDGGYVIGGSSESSDGDVQSGNKGGKDFWIVKIDENGTLLSEKSFGGSKDEIVEDIDLTSDGGYMLLGSVESEDGDISQHRGGPSDGWVVKLDENLNIEWERNYGGSGNEDARSGFQTMDGGYIFVGSTNSTDGDIQSVNHGDYDYYVIKVDGSGNVQWQNTYGGSDASNPYTIIPSAKGGYLVGGASKSNDGDVISGNKGLEDSWLVKIGDTGELEWEKSFGGSKVDRLYKIRELEEGGYMLGGVTNSSDGDINTEPLDYGSFWVIQLSEALE